MLVALKHLDRVFGVSESERGGKKNNINKHGEKLAEQKINTNGLFRLGFGSDFLTLVNDTGSIQVTNVAKENEGFAINVIPTVDDNTAMSSPKLDTTESIHLTLTSVRTHSATPVHSDSSYTNKLSLTLLNKANLQKLNANVPNDVDFDIGYRWFQLTRMLCFQQLEKYGLKKVTLVKGFFFFKFSFIKGVNSVLRDSPWMIHGVLIFLSKWSPFVSLLIEELSRSCSRLGNSIFFLSNSFEALQVDNLVSEEVDLGNKSSTSGVQREGQSFTLAVKCLGNLDNEDEVEPNDNKMASFLAKPSRVGYGTKSLLEQWTETYGEVEQECDYDPYDDDMYEGQVIDYLISRFEVDQ
nr:hypothetical protein [Tanacetum cinerariifolium]